VCTSIRAALKTIWTKEYIDTLAKRLSEYRGQLTLRLLRLFNSQYTLQGERLDELSQSNKEIVEVVSINSGTLQSAFNDYQQLESCRHEKAYNDVERRHAETIAAILTTRGGDSRAITSSSDSFLQTPLTYRLRTTATIYRQASSEIGTSGGHPDVETREFKDFTKRILDALHFQSISDRRAAIPPAHKRTSKWIYRKPKSSDQPWDSLGRMA
jgi:hypothetical protein